MSRILIVDDEPFNLDILRIFLTSLEYDIVEATCGQDALAKVDEWDLDLILLDMMMPDLSGEDVCKALQKREGFRTPVIFLSAKVGSEDVLRGLKAGAIDYLPKPIDLDLLQLKADRAIREYEAYRVLEHENRSLVQLAHYDGLTHLFNRNHLNIMREITTQSFTAAMMIDVTNFKQINDTHGHVQGDEVLIHIARLILDKVDDRQGRMSYRFGGDEFLILFNEKAVGAVVDFAKEVYESLSGTKVRSDTEDIEIFVRAGLYASTKAECVTDLLKKADAALIQAKKIDKDDFVVCTSDGTWR